MRYSAALKSYVGLSSEDKPDVAMDGETAREVDTGNEYIFYDGTWFPKQISGSVKDLGAVTPDDDNDLPKVTIALYVGGAGNITLITPAGTEVTVPGLLAGMEYDLPCKRVKASGTTATNILALYGE